MNGLTKNIITGIKGFGMGAANVIPGVSGGTIALLTGIFTEIIDSLNAMMDPSSWKLLLQGKFREFWRYIHGTFPYFHFPALRSRGSQDFPDLQKPQLLFLTAAHQKKGLSLKGHK